MAIRWWQMMRHIRTCAEGLPLASFSGAWVCVNVDVFVYDLSLQPGGGEDSNHCSWWWLVWLPVAPAQVVGNSALLS